MTAALAMRYETTAATVSRAIWADAGRIRAGSCAHDVGNDGQTHQSRLRSRDRDLPARRPRFSRSTASTFSHEPRCPGTTHAARPTL